MAEQSYSPCCGQEVEDKRDGDKRAGGRIHPSEASSQ